MALENIYGLAARAKSTMPVAWKRTTRTVSAKTMPSAKSIFAIWREPAMMTCILPWVTRRIGVIVIAIVDTVMAPVRTAFEECFSMDCDDNASDNDDNDECVSDDDGNSESS